MKKIILAGAATFLIVGSVVFANGISKKSNGCPGDGQCSTHHCTMQDKGACTGGPGCVCVK